MLSLKKDVTEALVQAAMLLILCAVQVEVPLPPRVPPSALPPPGPPGGPGVGSKTPDLDGFFTSRRLLGWVRSLDRLQFPPTEVETWLVQREAGPLPGGRSDRSSPLERPAVALDPQVRPGNRQDDDEEDEEQDEEHVVRRPVVGGGEEWRRSRAEGGGGPGGSSGLINSETDQTAVSLQECLRLLEETFPFTEEQEFRDAGDRSVELQRQSVSREPSLCPILRSESPSVDLELHWQDLLSIMEPENTAEMEPLHHNLNSRPWTGGRLCPELMTQALESLPAQEGPLNPAAAALLPLTPSAELDNHDPSLDTKAFLKHTDVLHGPPDHADLLEEPSEDFSPSLHHSFDITLLSQPMDPGTPDVHFHSGLPTPCASSGNGENLDLPATPSSMFLPEADAEEDDLPLIDLLENGSVLDAALEDGFSPELEEEGYLEEMPGRSEDHVGFSSENQAQLERLHEDVENGAESDSGLSLDFSYSPASSCVSEASSSYSSSSSSPSASSSTSVSAVGSPPTEDEAEERFAGSDMEIEMTIKQEELEEEEVGAVGGGHPGGANKLFTFQPGNHKLLPDFPWMEHVGHDHTYNQPCSSISSPSRLKITNKHSKAAPAHHSAKPYHRSLSSRLSQSRMWSRDERRARALRIPFSNELIVNLPVEEFNDLLTKYHLNTDQMNLIKDIRRRGKNKIAAQNCRKRKLDVLLELEDDVSALRRYRSQLLKEKEEALKNLRELKQRLGMLYQQVLSRLRDDRGHPLDAEKNLLQFGPNSAVMAASRQNRAEVPTTTGKASKKQKYKKK